MNDGRLILAILLDRRACRRLGGLALLAPQDGAKHAGADADGALNVTSLRDTSYDERSRHA